jgi:hypothetical protein
MATNGTNNRPVKVKLSLCSTKYNDMKMYWGSGGIATRILTSALDGSGLLHNPAALPPVPVG